MFQPRTDKIKGIYKEKPGQPKFLDKKVFKGKTNIYIDWANVFMWQNKLDWHVDTKRLYQFLVSFSQINDINIYQGFFDDNEDSKKEIERFEKRGYKVRTKPIKEIRIPIDAKSVPLDDATIVKRVVSKGLVRKMSVEDIENMNRMIRRINDSGEFFLVQHKCNFDVEMASDIRIDCLQSEDIETFVIISGDSDFIDTVDHLVEEGKNVVIIGTTGRISYELNNSNAYIYDIKQLKNYLCWSRESDL